jgi:hypothetical protein
LRRLRKLGVNTTSANAEKTDESANQKRAESSLNNNCTTSSSSSPEASDKKDDNKNTIFAGNVNIRMAQT